MSENALRGETSPYLLQHKDNPVHWRPWGEAALAEARAGNKPILLSVGYAACHWCHVMAHESFEDDAIAKLMNADFVSIKVDREERPDLDAVYQAALHAMGEQGGWPLTMFLAPDGAPFWGGTYFPPESRWGRPGFPDVLGAMARIWREEPDKIVHNTAALKEALADLARPGGGGGTLTLESLDRAALLALRLVDLDQGGTRGAPKFPQAPLFRLLWRAHLRTRAAGGLARAERTTPLKAAVLTTLDHICQGGIYDHLGGGMARYSTDAEWLAPHFEKMLYDNAMLVELLAEAWTETKSPLYAARAHETVAWLLAEMKTGEAKEGPFGLASAFDADSEGEEGKFYVWSESEIDSALGSDAGFFKKIYDVTAAGNWEGRNILRRDPKSGLLSDAERAGESPRASKDAPLPGRAGESPRALNDAPLSGEARLASLREKLLAVRARRIPPGCDDKVLADWNGMAAAALASAGATFGEAAWIVAAKNIFAFVTARLVGNDGRFRHSWRERQARHPATLDDLAQMGRAALALHEATGEGSYLIAAEKFAALADAHYGDKAEGGYFLSAADVTDVIQRTKPLFDNATPSGNGAMAEVLARLFHLTGNDSYRTRAEALFRALAPARVEMLINMPGLLCAFEYLERPTMIVVAGDAGAHATAELLAAAFALPAAAKIVQRVADGAQLPPAHPAHGKGPVGGSPAAYVCVGRTCGLPVTDAGALSAALAAQ